MLSVARQWRINIRPKREQLLCQTEEKLAHEIGKVTNENVREIALAYEKLWFTERAEARYDFSLRRWVRRRTWSPKSFIAQAYGNADRSLSGDRTDRILTVE